MARAPKKSETLEVRLPYQTKTAFMDRCARDGVTASQAVRGFIDARLAPARPRRLRRLAQVAAGALALLGVAATAVPSLAGTTERAGFDRLDLDRDGRLSPAELAAADRDGDGALSFREFRGQ